MSRKISWNICRAMATLGHLEDIFRAGISVNLAPQGRPHFDRPSRHSAGGSPEAVVSALAPASKLEASRPKSYHIAVGGTFEESAQSQAFVYAVVPLMLFIAITLLMMQLQSFSLLFLVVSVVPMGLIGVIAALLIFNKPLGFVAILGDLVAAGDDCAQRCHPDRPDRDCPGRGHDNMGRRRRGGDVPTWANQKGAGCHARKTSRHRMVHDQP
jgi:hypothetical protein